MFYIENFNKKTGRICNHERSFGANKDSSSGVVGRVQKNYLSEKLLEQYQKQSEDKEAVIIQLKEEDLFLRGLVDNNKEKVS